MSIERLDSPERRETDDSKDIGDKMPLAIDLYAGLGGWAEGLLSEGWEVIGFDIERHVFGNEKYPGQLVLQDVTTLHGSQFRHANLIVASPPCQAYAYRSFPFRRCKALPPPDNTLFDACFRLQREASEAAGRHIPLIVENVRGAQKWVGRARWHFGSYYLWGDVPALMPPTRLPKVGGPKGNDWFALHNRDEFGMRALENMRKGEGFGKSWWYKNGGNGRAVSSKSAERKYWSMQVSKIPLPLAAHIARTFKWQIMSAGNAQNVTSYITAD